MRSIRVGVVADTHCPEFLDELPQNLSRLLEGVELILHAGDIGSLDTIRTLERIAPVEAVRGDHDRGLDLPTRRVVEVGGRRIGILHGNRSHLIEEPATFVGTVSLGHWWPKLGIHGWLRSAFPEADAVVYGHTHHADSRHVAGALVFNPGAVYQVSPEEAAKRLARNPSWFEWSWLQVMRHRRVWPKPTVGILEIGDGGIVSRVLPL